MQQILHIPTLIYQSTDTSSIISIPDLASALSVNMDSKFYILLIMNDESSEYWAYSNPTERDKDLQAIIDLQIVLHSPKN